MPPLLVQFPQPRRALVPFVSLCILFVRLRGFNFVPRIQRIPQKAAAQQHQRQPHGQRNFPAALFPARGLRCANGRGRISRTRRTAAPLRGKRPKRRSFLQGRALRLRQLLCRHCLRRLCGGKLCFHLRQLLCKLRRGGNAVSLVQRHGPVQQRDKRRLLLKHQLRAARTRDHVLRGAALCKRIQHGPQKIDCSGHTRASVVTFRCGIPGAHGGAGPFARAVRTLQLQRTAPHKDIFRMQRPRDLRHRSQPLRQLPHRPRCPEPVHPSAAGQKHRQRDSLFPHGLPGRRSPAAQPQKQRRTHAQRRRHSQYNQQHARKTGRRLAVRDIVLLQNGEQLPHMNAAVHILALQHYKRIDPDKPAARIHKRPAGIAGADGRVRLDRPRALIALRPALPHRAHDAVRHRDAVHAGGKFPAEIIRRARISQRVYRQPCFNRVRAERQPGHAAQGLVCF